MWLHTFCCVWFSELQTGMCASHLIRSSRAPIPKCDWLYSDIHQISIYSDKWWTFGIPRNYTRLVFFGSFKFLTLDSFETPVLILNFTLSDEVIEAMISRGRQVRCLWVYASEAEPCSAMVGIMWELQRKVRLFYQSAETFWLHNGSVVNKDLVEFHHWTTPVPLPWYGHRSKRFW